MHLSGTHVAPHRAEGADASPLPFLARRPSSSRPPANGAPALPPRPTNGRPPRRPPLSGPSIAAPTDAIQEQAQLKAALHASLLHLDTRNEADADLARALEASLSPPELDTRVDTRIDAHVDNDPDLTRAIEASLREPGMHHAIAARSESPATPPPLPPKPPQYASLQSRRTTLSSFNGSTSSGSSMSAGSSASTFRTSSINSSATSLAEGVPLPNGPDEPIHPFLKLGTAKSDGNCFFNSLMQLAAPEIAMALGRNIGDFDAQDVRDHVVAHTVELLIQCNSVTRDDAGVEQAEALFKKHPFLEDLMGGGPQGVDQHAMAPSPAARLGVVLSPTQQARMDELRSRSGWAADSGDLIAMATVAAIPNLRVAIINPGVTKRNLDHYVYGAKESPLHLMYLSGEHYVPAWAP